MKKNYFKPNRLLIVVLILFIVTSFYSCDKSDENVYGTWESDYFEVEYKDPALPPHPYLDEELILRGKMTLELKSHTNAYMFFNSLELFDKKNDIIYDNTIGHDLFYQDIHHTYNGRKFTLTFGDYGFFRNQTWTGKVKKHTIDLTIIFGETVTFRKQ